MRIKLDMGSTLVNKIEARIKALQTGIELDKHYSGTELNKLQADEKARGEEINLLQDSLDNHTPM